MATDFFIPKLGQTVEEVTLVKWLVEDGAKVEAGDEILEVETDKATFPVPANSSGYLHIGPYKAGDMVPVLGVVATIGEKDEAFAPGSGGEAPGKAPESATAPAASKTTPARESPEGERVFASPRARKIAAERGVDLSQVVPGGGSGARVTERDVLAYLEATPKATPVAQKMAADMGVDLRTVADGGEGGRITKDDVMRAAAPSEQQPAAAPVERTAEQPAPARPAPAAETAPAPEAQTQAGVSERVPLKGVRGVIARRMAESVQTTARVTLVTEVDATEFVDLRERLKARFTEEWGFTPGYNDLLALIVANGLRQFPYMNARLSAEGDAIERLADVHLGMAVDTERGLMVVVIRDADKKGLREFGAEFRQLVERARAGKSAPDDLSGSTFSITNLGMYRVDAFTPVINLPEAAILGVGRIMAKPVVKNGEIVVRQMLTLSLVFDHRLTDGAPAARFLDHICELIEEPALMFLTRR